MAVLRSLRSGVQKPLHAALSSSTGVRLEKRPGYGAFRFSGLPRPTHSGFTFPASGSPLGDGWKSWPWATYQSRGGAGGRFGGANSRRFGSEMSAVPTLNPARLDFPNPCTGVGRVAPYAPLGNSPSPSPHRGDAVSPKGQPKGTRAGLTGVSPVHGIRASWTRKNLTRSCSSRTPMP